MNRKACLFLILGVVVAAAGCASEHATMLEQAERGDKEAQHNLGVMYDDGEGVPEDDAKAVTWYRMAAAQGYAAAQNNLGVM